MKLLAEQQYRGIPDLATPDIDWRHEFAKLAALPTGVVYRTTTTGATDETVAFEGLDGGRLNLTSPTSTRYLRFDGWTLADPTKFRRVLFEIEGIYFDSGNSRNIFVGLRDTSNVAHGCYWGTRGSSSPQAGEISYNNGTSGTTTALTWGPAVMKRGLKLTMGIGYEYDPMLGKKDILVTCNGKVAYRVTQSAMSIAGALLPAMQLQSATGTTQVYLHGARIRIWRHRGT